MQKQILKQNVFFQKGNAKTNAKANETMQKQLKHCLQKEKCEPKMQLQNMQLKK